MHAVFLGYYFDDALPDSSALLRSYETTPLWCEALRSAGVEKVTVVQRFKKSERFERNGVSYVLVADHYPHNLSAWHRPAHLHSMVASLCPDVLHVNGGVFQIPSLRAHVGKRVAILWQHHAGFPTTKFKQMAYRWAMSTLDGYLFASNDIAEPWKQASIIRPHQVVHEIMEASSTFSPLPRKHCRQVLGIEGSPLFLWVGRLNGNKDPETVVRGFAQTVGEFPDPALYLVYHEEELLASVQSVIRELNLTERIHLVGRVDHETLNLYYGAADYFLLGSHHEGSGFALLEALACGVTPVVTDIPSFRTLTKDGTIGALWQPSDPASLARAMRRAAREATGCSRIREFFEQNWSYEVLGRRAAEAYRMSCYRNRIAHLDEGVTT